MVIAIGLLGLLEREKGGDLVEEEGVEEEGVVQNEAAGVGVGLLLVVVVVEVEVEVDGEQLNGRHSGLLHTFYN